VARRLLGCVLVLAGGAVAFLLGRPGAASHPAATSAPALLSAAPTIALITASGFLAAAAVTVVLRLRARRRRRFLRRG
jgi:hypothetical protein